MKTYWQRSLEILTENGKRELLGEWMAVYLPMTNILQ